MFNYMEQIKKRLPFFANKGLKIGSVSRSRELMRNIGERRTQNRGIAEGVNIHRYSRRCRVFSVMALRIRDSDPARCSPLGK